MVRTHRRHVGICEYALTSIIYDIDDVQSSNPLELEDETQDQIKEEESTVEEVDQSNIGSSPREITDSQGFEYHVPDFFKEKGSEGEDDQSGARSYPQEEMVDETVVEVISCDISKTHGDAELLTQDIKWQDTMSAKNAALIGDETWDLVLCPDDVQTVGCMWVDNRESQLGGTADSFYSRLEAKGFNQQA